MMMSKEVADEYLSSLTDLTINSKPLINMLTILAEENADHACAIVHAIESHIEKVSPEVKLPVLYLIDSIIKNVGKDYLPLFTQNIVKIFASVFEKVDEKTRTSMFKLRGTWNEHFPATKMHLLDLRIQHVDPQWPLTAPPPSIHLNPKFLPPRPSASPPASKQSTEQVDPKELKATFLKKQQILMELQEKKKQLEQMQKNPSESTMTKGRNNNASKAVVQPSSTVQVSAVKTKIAPATSMLIEAAKSRDPRLARLPKTGMRSEESRRVERDSDEEEQRRNLQLDMLRRSELAKAHAAAKLSDPRVEKKVLEVSPEVKKTENDIQLRQTAMLKAPVLAQLNHSEGKPSSESAKSKRIRSPDIKDRSRRDKRNSPRKEEKQPKESNRSPKKSRENKATKSAPKRKIEEKKYERKREKKSKVRSVSVNVNVRQSSLSPCSSPSPPPSGIDDSEEYNPATFVPELPPPEPLRSPVKPIRKPVEPIVPEPPPPPVLRQEQPKVTEDDLEDVEVMREEALKTKSKSKEPVGFKHLKKAGKGRNYSRRNKERSTSASPPADIDFRLGVSDVSSTTEDSPSHFERHEETETIVDVAKDVDFRQLSLASPGNKRVSTEAREDEPPSKKGKTEDSILQLFGNKDMDERMITPQRLPTPPPPPLISTSPPASPKKPPSPPTLLVKEEIEIKEEPLGSLSPWSDSKPDVNEEKVLPLSSQLELQVAHLEQEQNRKAMKSPQVRERDRLGRVLLYDKLPTDPRARRESLGSQASHEENRDTDIRRDEEFQMDHVDSILAQAHEQVECGQMTRQQYNELVSQIVRLSEQQKIRDAVRMGQRSRPFGGVSPEYEGTNRVRFGDTDYRHRGRARGGERPRRGYGRGAWRRGGRRGGHDEVPFPLEHHRRFAPPEMSPEYFDTEAKSQDAWMHDLEASDLPMIPPTDPAQLDAIAADPTKFIAIDGTPRPIRFYGFVAVYIMSFGQAKEISFENGIRCVMVAGLEIPCQLNGPPVNFIFKNNTHSVRLGAPTRELYVDNHFYEAHFGGPPVSVDISGVACKAQLQGPPPQVRFSSYNSPYCLGIVQLVVDARTSFQIFLDAKPQRFDVAGLPLVLRFINALTTVLINDVEVNLKFGGVAPISVAGSQHFLSLSELPPGVIPGRVSIRGMENTKENNVEAHDNNSSEARLEEPIIASSVVKRELYLDMLNSTMGAVPVEDKAVGFSYKVEPSEGLSAVVVTPPIILPPTSIPPPVTSQPPPVNVNDLLQSLLSTGLIGQKKPEPKPHSVPPAVKRVSFSDTNSLRERQPGLVSFLYSGIQCGSCGVRFSPDDTVRYSQHLDWHFRQNRRDRDAAKRGVSRRWYYDVSDWIQFEEIEDLEERAQSWFETEGQVENEDGLDVKSMQSVPAPPGEGPMSCLICHDKFDTFFHQETEEWHLRNCLALDDSYYHPTCYQDSLKEPEDLLAVEKMESEPIRELPLLDRARAEPKVEKKEIEDSIILVEDIDDDDEIIEGEVEVVTADEEAVLAVVKGLIDYVIAEEDCDARGPIEDDELEVLAVTNKDENKAPVDVIDVPEAADDEVYFPPSPEVFDPEKAIKSEPADEMESAVEQVDQTVSNIVTSIDGNVVMAEAAAAPTQSKIKITFNKPVAQPELPKEPVSEAADDPTDLQIEEIEPEPLPLKPKKPRIAEKEMTVYPPTLRGTEISGLCSIM